MKRRFRGLFLGAALAGGLALGLSPAAAQSDLEVAPFPGGFSDGTVTVSERTGRIYIARSPIAATGDRRDFVTVFDGETHAQQAPLFFGGDPIVGEVAVHPTNGRIYVSLFNESAVAVVDEATGRLVLRIPVQDRPLGMALDPDGNRLYVAHHDSPALSTINTLAERAETPMIGPEQVVNLPRSTSAGLAVDTRTGQIYHRVTLAESGRSALFWLFRDAPGRIQAVTVFDSGSGQLLFNPFTGTGYLALEEQRQLQSVTGGNALTVQSTVPGEFVRPHGLALDPTTSRLYVTDFGSDRVAIFDVAAANALRPRIRELLRVGQKPRAIAVNSLTHRAYLLNTGTPSISVIRDRRFALPSPVVTTVPNVESGQWTNQDLSLGLSFGPGLIGGPRELVFQTLGTVQIPRSTTASPVTISFRQEGSSTLHFAARGQADVLASASDPSIFLSPPGEFQVKIDKTLPVVTLGTVDRKRWYGGGEPVVSGAAVDALSGLADPGNDAMFILRAVGRQGEEIADGVTDSRTISDLAGNAVLAGPITGIRIDRKAPALTVQSPADGASLLLNQKVVARFTARDGGSGLKSARGFFLSGDVIASGGRLLTGQVGRGQPFVVVATDNVGNESSVPRSYTVRYRIRRLDSGSFKIPGNLAWKLQLQDAAKKNQSVRTIPVIALRIEPVAGGAATELNQPFIFNPTLGGRGGGYELSLSFASLARGAYRLLFTADGVGHETRFTVR